MNLATKTALLSLFLLPACEMLGGDSATMPNIQEMLAGVTDEASAQQAKGPLDSAVAQLKAALATAQGQGEGEGEAAAGEGQSMMQSVLGQFGIGPETVGMIEGLMAKPEIQAVLGQTLEQLKGLIPAM
jgi:FMN-dependent NADH-azoreductase